MRSYLNILFLLFVAASCNNKTETETTAAAKTQDNENLVQLTDAQIQNAGIKTGKAAQRNMSQILKVHGYIDVPPQNIISVSIPMGGYLKSTKLLEGMHVNKGESIAVIEDPQYIQMQEDYLTTKARLDFIETGYNRQKILNQNKATSDKQFQQTQADYRSLQVRLSALRAKLQLIGLNPDKLNENNLSKSINVYSTINGYVTKVNVNIGKYVNPADVLFEIVDPSDIHLALNIFEKDLDKLKIGQHLTAYTNNDTSKKHDCEIVLIGKELSQDRNIEVHCHFEKYDNTLIPGMFMNADIQTENNNVWVLPSDAIVTYENKNYAFAQRNNNSFEITQVKTGVTQNGYTELLLTDTIRLQSSVFVINGAYSLLMKMRNTEEE